MLVVPLIATPVLAFFAIGLGFNGEWWGILSGLALGFAIVFAYGIFETAAKVPRNDKGRPDRERRYQLDV